MQNEEGVYHYVESGLDNVYLINGVKLHNTVYGEGVSIENLKSLHKLIAHWIVDLPTPITFAEFKFLASEMEIAWASRYGLPTEEQPSMPRPTLRARYLAGAWIYENG